MAIARILLGLAFLALIGAWISQFAGGSFMGFGQQLSPMVAALAMSLSSVSVIANALRLRSLKLIR